MTLKLIRIILLLSLIAHLCSGQQAPVTWNHTMHRIGGHEWMLTTKATLAPGWHIYSQHLREGGPIPTRFSVIPNDDYSLVGIAEENGKAFHFYDSLYGMNITWYSGEVSFHQRVSMIRMVPELRGILQYMICNNSQCIPHEHNFTVHVDTKN